MRNEIILSKMLGYIEKILQYCENEEYPAFEQNSMRIEACVFNLSQIGELTSRLDDAFTDAHPEIPWRQLRGLRNRIVHDYEGVNLHLVWEIIESDLPILQQQLKSIL